MPTAPLKTGSVFKTHKSERRGSQVLLLKTPLLKDVFWLSQNDREQASLPIPRVQWHFCWLVLPFLHKPMLVPGSPEHGAEVLETLLYSTTHTWLAASMMNRFMDMSIWEYLEVQPVQSPLPCLQSCVWDIWQSPPTAAPTREL